MCVYVYIYIYTHICVCIYIYIHVHNCICMSIYIYIYICICIHTCVYVAAKDLLRARLPSPQDHARAPPGADGHNLQGAKDRHRTAIPRCNALLRYYTIIILDWTRLDYTILYYTILYYNNSIR